MVLLLFILSVGCNWVQMLCVWLHHKQENIPVGWTARLQIIRVSEATLLGVLKWKSLTGLQCWPPRVTGYIVNKFEHAYGGEYPCTVRSNLNKVENVRDSAYTVRSELNKSGWGRGRALYGVGWRWGPLQGPTPCEQIDKFDWKYYLATTLLMGDNNWFRFYEMWVWSKFPWW